MAAMSREIEADGFITRDEDLRKEDNDMADCAWAKPLVDKERAIGKWAWIEALKVVAEHIDDEGNIDPKFGKDIKRYVEARK